jgi:hypothetical protein
MKNWKQIFEASPRILEPEDKRESKHSYIKRIAQQEGIPFKLCKRTFYRGYNKEHPALEKEANKVGIPVGSVGHYWHKGKHFSIFAKNNQKSYFDVRDEIVESMKAHAPNNNINFNYQSVKNPHLLVIDPADIHIGKLCKAIETGDEYNVDIAVQRIVEGLTGLLTKVSPFAIDQILLIIGNDILHTDNAKRTTTSGTPQDTDGMWYSNFLIAKDIYIHVIDKLITIAPVVVKHNPSNHDYTHGFFLADTISSWYNNKSDFVKFDSTPSHRKYHVYGNNLIGTTHGDGAKLNDLPLLMAQEASEDWHKCKHRYFYTHHIHHKTAKEIGSVTIESVRSASGTDSWHHRNGYQHAAKAIEAYLHDPNQGQIARFTHIFS